MVGMLLLVLRSKVLAVWIGALLLLPWIGVALLALDRHPTTSACDFLGFADGLLLQPAEIAARSLVALGDRRDHLGATSTSADLVAKEARRTDRRLLLRAKRLCRTARRCR